MGISIKDLADLARAGFTPASVKEIITLSEKEDTAKTEERQEATGATEHKPESAEPIEATEKEDTAATPETEVINYKALYEKSQEDLQKAQAANRSADLSGKQPEYDFHDLYKTISEL